MVGVYEVVYISRKVLSRTWPARNHVHIALLFATPSAGQGDKGGADYLESLRALLKRFLD